MIYVGGHRSPSEAHRFARAPPPPSLRDGGGRRNLDSRFLSCLDSGLWIPRPQAAGRPSIHSPVSLRNEHEQTAGLYDPRRPHHEEHPREHVQLRRQRDASDLLPPTERGITVRVLVTGATGYVGGRLVPRLLQEGHDVACLARDPERLAHRPSGVIRSRCSQGISWTATASTPPSRTATSPTTSCTRWAARRTSARRRKQAPRTSGMQLRRPPSGESCTSGVSATTSRCRSISPADRK